MYVRLVLWLLQCLESKCSIFQNRRMGVGLTRTKIEFPIELSLYVKVDLLKNESKPQCLLPPPSPISVFCFLTFTIFFFATV